MKKLGNTSLKILASAGILWFIFSQVDMSQVKENAASLSFKTIMLCILLQVTSYAIQSYRWQLIGEKLYIFLSYSFYLKHFLTGLLFNQVLPGGIGGDAWRILAIHKKAGRGKGAFATVLTDRIVGLIALLIIVAGFTFTYLTHADEAPYVYLFPLMAFGGIFGFFIGTHPTIVSFLERFIPKHFAEKLNFYQLIISIRENLSPINEHTLKIYSTSLAIQFLAIVQFFIIAHAIQPSVTLMELMPIAPIAFLSMIIPISFAGWGIREGIAVGLCVAFGVLTADEALTTSVVYGLTLIISSLLGVFTFLLPEKEIVTHLTQK